jgi:hypothetical protein
MFASELVILERWNQLAVPAPQAWNYIQDTWSIVNFIPTHNRVLQDKTPGFKEKHLDKLLNIVS